NIAVACRHRAERAWLRRIECLERRKLAAERRNELGGRGKILVGDMGARLGRVQVGALAASQLRKLVSEHSERMRQASAPRARARPAQDGALERGDAAFMRAGGGAQSKQSMFEQRQQGDRR